MKVFAFEYVDGFTLPIRIPGHPDDARLIAEFGSVIKRRKAEKKSKRGVLREATAEEIQKWKITVPI